MAPPGNPKNYESGDQFAPRSLNSRVGRVETPAFGAPAAGRWGGVCSLGDAAIGGPAVRHMWHRNFSSVTFGEVHPSFETGYTPGPSGMPAGTRGPRPGRFTPSPMPEQTPEEGIGQWTAARRLRGANKARDGRGRRTDSSLYRIYYGGPPVGSPFPGPPSSPFPPTFPPSLPQLLLSLPHLH